MTTEAPKVKIIPHGIISIFDPKVETAECYVLRFELYFTSRCLENNLKVSSFFSSIDPKSFSLVVNLLHLMEIQKATYNQVGALLKKHYRPKLVIIYERFMFNSRTQMSSESISYFLRA